MALILRDIYEESRRRFRLELLAGERGLQRVMQWVYVTEDYATADFLHGGELIITTGVTSGGSPAWLMRFLEQLLPREPCGVIVNLGPYLRREDIPPEALALCDRSQLPLLVMPWRIHIYDITRDYCDRIFLDSRRDEAANQAFLSLFDPAANHAAALAALPDFRFPAGAAYRVAAFGRAAPREPSPADNSRLMARVFSRLAALPWACFPVNRNGALFLVCQQPDPAPVCALVGQLQEIFAQESGFSPVYAGVGGQAAGLAELARSCRQAQAALRLGLHRGAPLLRYEEMGFFRLLLEVGDPAVLRDYADAHLGPVHAYDAKHGSDFSRTLYLYLLYDQSVQAVADASYCHRNTVRHRLTLLREAMGYRLDDPTARFELMAAFLAEEYLQVQESPAEG